MDLGFRYIMGQVFEVEEIIGKRTITITQYRAKWKNYPDEEATWESEDNLVSCRDLIEEFEAKSAVTTANPHGM
jgi:hypothetical protein